jgi:phosphohistidine phosphatase SixA
MASIALHLLRHGHAGDPLKWEGDDAVRPLSAKGRAQADRLGAHLAKVGFETDSLLTSPKARARETAELVGRRLGVKAVVDDRLGEPLTIVAIERILADAGDPRSPVLVGHDPDFSELLALLVGATELPMRKGAMARVDLDRPVTPAAGVLRWLLPPDLVPEKD